MSDTLESLRLMCKSAYLLMEVKATEDAGKKLNEQFLARAEQFRDAALDKGERNGRAFDVSQIPFSVFQEMMDEKKAAARAAVASSTA